MKQLKENRRHNFPKAKNITDRKKPDGRRSSYQVTLGYEWEVRSVSAGEH